MIRTLFLALAACLMAGCTTVETSGSLGQLAALRTSDERIELRVRTGDAHMDQILYEVAYQQFSQVIPIRETGPYTGALELTFSTSTQSGFVGSSSSTANTTGSVWYTGHGATGTATTTGASFWSGAELQWQNSIMLATLKHADGERLWSADYNYKGGWELSGYVVNTPEEAARYVTKKLRERYTADAARH